ncbi:uncharacterized protein LOC132717358 [Ruditapes philippinarum]|uniref:uncharacterized protein LOC132717358 n=1 Tax=Ruditapes philippinarum TaxID=129788 RepID=UPI00295A7849|nr:uncharacterized protein LOC132717358 [Ruditapes philippinarum]
MMMMNYITFVFGLAILSSADGSEIVIQAEDMIGDVSEVNHRQHASGYKAVHLYTGNILQTELCFISGTKFTVNEIEYSNDGPSDMISVSLDKVVIDEFRTVALSDGGLGWDMFKPHQSMVSTITEGHHMLTIKVIQSDQHGVEIDYIKVSVNYSQTIDSLSCKSFCFEDATYPHFTPSVSPSAGYARAVQRSVPTKCAEEDNINIPVFYESSSSLSFVVTASLPKYNSFQNNRGADWTNCQMYDAFWKYKNITLNSEHSLHTKSSSLRIYNVSPGLLGTRKVILIEVDFELEGPSTGSTDSEIGAHFNLQNIRYDGSLSFQFQYYNRYNIWSPKQDKTVKISESSIKFVTPDFTFREGKGNKIRIEVYGDPNSNGNITIGDIFMFKRPMRNDQSTTLYKDGATVIEGVDVDMWWRINETMCATVKGVPTTFSNIDYLRIYRRVPWTVNGFSQVFVLYQDANIRLLPTTPHGLDWIPFGSSVIIGQTDPLSNRPYSPISHLDIDPDSLHMTIFFTDSNVVSINMQTTMTETQLHVTATHLVKDASLHPFFTFRSMFVANDNNDVDHIVADGGVPMKIGGDWNDLRGHYFAFYRQCISKHNTQSPDISLLIKS